MCVAKCVGVWALINTLDKGDPSLIISDVVICLRSHAQGFIVSTLCISFCLGF